MQAERMVSRNRQNSVGFDYRRFRLLIPLLFLLFCVRVLKVKRDDRDVDFTREIMVDFCYKVSESVVT